MFNSTDEVTAENIINSGLESVFRETSLQQINTTDRTLNRLALEPCSSTLIKISFQKHTIELDVVKKIGYFITLHCCAQLKKTV